MTFLLIDIPYIIIYLPSIFQHHQKNLDQVTVLQFNIKTASHQ